MLQQRGQNELSDLLWQPRLAEIGFIIAPSLAVTQTTCARLLLPNDGWHDFGVNMSREFPTHLKAPHDAHSAGLSPRRENTWAVVVTFNPDEGLPERLSAIAAQVREVVVVDNSTSADHARSIEQICACHNYRLIINGENRGVATALNQGIALAQGACTWVLTMDQDTIVLPQLLSTLRSAYDDCPFAERVGIIGSPLNNRGYERRLASSLCVGKSYHEVKTVITSGSLVHVETYQKIGGFRDDLFVDCVDCEYCLRLAKNGYRTIEANEFGMIHSIGSPRERRLLWKRPSPSNHSVIRRYYIARNRLAVAMEYFWTETRWACRVFKVQVKELLLVVLFENQKWLKLRASALGAWHALIGRTGQLPDKRWLT